MTSCSNLTQGLIFGILAALLVGLFLGILVGRGNGIALRESQAVDVGVAKYVKNDSTEKRLFMWILPVPPVQAPTIDPLHKVEKIEPEKIR